MSVLTKRKKYGKIKHTKKIRCQQKKIKYEYGLQKYLNYLLTNNIFCFIIFVCLNLYLKFLLE